MTVPKKDPQYWDRIAAKYPPPPAIRQLASALSIHPGELHARVHIIQDLALDQLAWRPSPRRLITAAEITQYREQQQKLIEVLTAIALLGTYPDPVEARGALRNIIRYLDAHPASRVPCDCGHKKAAVGCYCQQNWLYRSWVTQGQDFLAS